MSVKFGHLAGLSAVLDGRLIRPGDRGYEHARRVWNGEIDRRPPAIVRCASVADVRAAVGAAAECGVPVAVRGGGHSVAGHALCEDGVVVDLSQLRGVDVDHRRGVVHVDGGALWSDVDQRTQPYGLAVPGGVVSHTGVGGLTLGGGIGYLVRRCGLTIDSLVEATVVTPDGRMARVDAETDPEFLWALRGGGGNFGVVTQFGFRLHRVGPQVLAGMIVYSFKDASSVLSAYREVIASAPDELGTLVNLRICPPLDILPRDRHGTPVVVIVVCWSGAPEQGWQWIHRLRGLALPVADTVGHMPYLRVQQLADTAAPYGHHYYWRSVNFSHLTDEIIELIVDSAARITSPLSAVPIYHLGGAAGRVTDDGTAYGPRHHQHNINIFAGWSASDPDRERHVTWVRDFSDMLAPHASGRYVNFLSDEGADSVRAAYGDRWRRLVDLKRRVDPDNTFRYNHNIRPEA